MSDVTVVAGTVVVTEGRAGPQGAPGSGGVGGGPIDGADITTGTVADARIASTVARDTEVTAAVAAEAALRSAADLLLQALSAKGQANGYPALDGTGKIPTSQLPALAISNTFVVGSQAAMLALTADTGDIAIRTDVNKSFVLQGADPTILGNWQELLAPPSSVSSVDGRQGVVSLSDLYDAIGAAAAAQAFAIQRSNHTGTQLASTISNFDTAVRVSRLDQMAAPSNDVSMASHKLTNLTNPASAQDADTKAARDAAIAALRSLADGNDTTVNTSVTGQASIDLSENITVTSVRLASGVIVTGVRAATAVALPACTYANGTAGVGATLTGNANGALADQDLITLVANDRLLVMAQVAPEQNGIYVVTQVGTAGTPFILTRATDADQAAEYLAGIVCYVSEGGAFSGVVLRSQAGQPSGGTTPTPTMGTTAIRWVGDERPNVTPADIWTGTRRNEARYYSDFWEVDTDLVVATAAVQRLPGTEWSAFLAGTASKVTQVGVSEARRGVIDLQTGTTTTGSAAFGAGSTGSATTFDTTKRFAMYAIAKTPTLSDGTNTYAIRLGGFTSINPPTAPTFGIYFQARSGQNWEAVCMHASTSNGTSPNGVDTGIAQSTGYKSFAIVYDPATSTAFFYIGFVLVAAVTTNFPSGDGLLLGGYILKSAGTTSRSLYVDLCEFDVPDIRSLANNPLVP